MEKKELTVDVITGAQFVGKSVTDVQWLPDSTAFTFTNEDIIFRHDVKTHQVTPILDPASLKFNGKPITMSEYSTTGHQNHLLIAGQKKQIWRHSFAAPYYLYNMQSAELVSLANGELLQNVTFSPDNQFVAFVRQSNLYVATPGGEVKQLTFDGSDNVLNGIFDWVYEEEFSRADAIRWSPDSTKIAFWRTDQTRVKTFIMLDETGRYTKTTELKYPKVGEQNAIVKIGVVDIKTQKTSWMNITGPGVGTPEDPNDFYIPRIDWTTSPNVLAIQRLNRKQNFFELLFANAETGETRLILTEESKTGWIDITDDFIFFKKKEEFLWTSEREGYRHIYHSDYSGKQINRITKDNLDVTSVIGFNEETGWIYFYCLHNNFNQVVYRVSLDGSSLQLISQSEGWTTAKFSPNYQFYFCDRSTARTPNQYFLYDNTGNQLVVLEENAIPAFSAYSISFPEFFELKIEDEETGNPVTLSSYIIKPKNFDEKKKYPVLVFGYSGPVIQSVCNKWIRLRSLWHSLITQLDVVIFCIDQRGCGGRGTLFKHKAYGDLSKYLVLDHIAAVKYLRSLSFVDSSRIGFWGWSGGGYLACMLMTRASEYFKFGIAVAPVSDFRNYDTIWTERYMGLIAENESGYKAANVLTYTNGLKGPLLLVHGSGDDNVHLQNTMMFVDALIAANKQFEMMIYPNRNHGIYGNNATRHLFTLLTNFVKKNIV